MSHVKVRFDHSRQSFDFQIVDPHGEVTEFSLHPVNTIELIQEIKREVRNSQSADGPIGVAAKRAMLKLIRSEDDQ
jgi:hypothetical protein